LPIGDWTINQYGPYVGCTDGAKEAIVWLLERAEHWGLKVWLDLHAIKGSQNGYDNSGLSNKTVWLDETHYEHWDHQSANWMGEWDEETMTYTTVVTQNVVDTLD
jgi:glucan 1,3-beta-glucosidase